MILSKIKRRIVWKGRGAIFAASDFLDIGSRASVDQALSRLSDQVVGKVARALDAKDRALLARQSRHVPAWMHPVVQQIVAQA